MSGLDPILNARPAVLRETLVNPLIEPAAGVFRRGGEEARQVRRGSPPAPVLRIDRGPGRAPVPVANSCAPPPWPPAWQVQWRAGGDRRIASCTSGSGRVGPY